MSTRPENSTNGRAPHRAPTAPWYLKAGLATLGTVAPPLASAWAEQLFCTPPRPPLRPAEAEALADAHAGSLQVGGRRLATWTWGRGPAVLLVHGWGGRGAQLHGFVRPLLAAGLSVVTFDGPGHGASEGRLSSLVEHGRAVREVAEALPTELRAVIAHSMGDAATALAMAAGAAPARAAFVAPPSSAASWVLPFSAALGLPDKVRDGMVNRLEERLHVRLVDLEMERIAPEMRTPLLVVHDTEDREVPYSSGATLAARWPGARLSPRSGLGHKRILGDAGVIEEIVGFVRAG